MGTTLKENRDFKGVWIDRAIWLDKNLTATEKCLLAEIDSLDNKDHCYAKNEYFAEFLGVSSPTISRGIQKLISLGYVETVVFTGRNRILKSMIRLPSQNDQADSSKRSGSVVKKTRLNSNPDSNPDTKEKTTVPEEPAQTTRLPTAQPKPKGDPRVPELIAHYHDLYVQHAGCKPPVSGAWGQNFKQLLKTYDLDQLKHIIEYFFAYDGRTQYGFFTFVGKVGDLAPNALKTMPREDRSITRLHRGDEGYVELTLEEFHRYRKERQG